MNFYRDCVSFKEAVSRRLAFLSSLHVRLESEPNATRSIQTHGDIAILAIDSLKRKLLEECTTTIIANLRSSVIVVTLMSSLFIKVIV